MVYNLYSYSIKNGIEISLNVDVVQRLDSKVFIAIMEDFKTLKRIQLASDVCSMQQLERKDELIVFSQQKQAEMEAKKFS